MGLELSEERRIQEAARLKLPYPIGPLVSTFNREEIATAIESEAVRVGHLPHPKITLHMDVADALLLAKILRYGATV